MRPPVGNSDVTVVITSCGRQDLLERTLDTFLSWNTYPIAGIVVVEDGHDSINHRSKAKYSDQPMRWLATGERASQVAAIDLGYASVTTPYIFHCEDDWEFHAPGFIEASKALLESMADVHIVALRAEREVPSAGLGPEEISPSGIAFRPFDINSPSLRHGFTWNPGLRRRSDYLRVAPLQDHLILRGRSSPTAELELGRIYKDMGYRGVLLSGEGYVRHIGEDRPVELNKELLGRGEALLCRKYPDYRSCSALARPWGLPAWKRLLARAAVCAPGPAEIVSLVSRLLMPLRWLPLVRAVALVSDRTASRVRVLRGAIAELGSWAALEATFGSKLPVLCYHHVGPSRPGTFAEFSISPAQFERQMRWLARRGYSTVTMADWLAWRDEAKPLPRKPVLLTFDDGYADTAQYALPVLERLGLKAVVFIVTGEIAGSNRWDQVRGAAELQLMDAQDIRELASRSIEFGAHSRTHADLTKLNRDALYSEVAGSRAELEALISSYSVNAFAYPFGRSSDEVNQVVRQTFDLAFTTEEGLNHLSTDPWRMRRSQVTPTDSLLDLELRLRLGWSPLSRARQKISAVRRRLVGSKRSAHRELVRSEAD